MSMKCVFALGRNTLITVSNERDPVEVDQERLDEL